jgi:hypothetical protein
MPEWVVFNELVFTHKTFMRTVSRIDPEWLFECAPHYYDLSLLPNNVVTQRLANVWNGIVAKKEKKRRK